MVNSLSRRRVYAPVTPLSGGGDPNYGAMARYVARMAAQRAVQWGVTQGTQYAWNKAKNYVKKRTMGGKYKYIHSNRNGNMRVKVSSSKRKRRKRTLKKRIGRLEKNAPKKSVYQYLRTNMIHMRQSATGAVNTSNKVLYNLRGFTSNEVDNEMLSIEYDAGPSDLTTQNTGVKCSLWMHAKVKNAGLHAVELKYVKYITADHNSNGPLEVARVEAVGSNYTITNTVQSATSAAAGNSYIPEYLELKRDENLQTIIGKVGNSRVRTFKTGKISKVTLNPGDELEIYHKNSFVYKPKVKDEEAQTYLKGYDMGIVFEIVGELAHGQAVGTEDIVNFSDWRLDGFVKKKCTLTLVNGLGLDKYEYITDSGTPSAPTAYVQAGANNEIE